MKLIKNENFFFGRDKSAYIFVKKSFSNFFFTLTDLNKKVIVSCSSGSSDVFFSRKQKMSPYVVENVFKKLLFFLKLYSIKFLRISLKLRVSSHIYFLIKELNYYGYSVSHIFEKNRVPHNGVKTRKRPKK